jgi:hypothetical protein
MKAELLRKHIYATYLTLRYGMAAIAVFFPMLLYLGGRFYGVSPQDSMSAYYFASAQGGGEPPMRVWFIGLLFALGICLILYRGFSKKEDLLLDFAGLFAICVALFPMQWNCVTDCPTITPHGIFAVLLFSCIGTVSLICTKETLRFLPDEKLRLRYRAKYRFIGAVMIASPLSAFVATSLLDDHAKYRFFIETSGIMAFAYYWWTKNRELAESEGELLALQGKIET